MTAPFLTDEGLARLLAASPENPVKVKYMAVDITDGTPSQSMTALFNEAHRVEIPNPVRSPEDAATLMFTGTIPESVGGWTIYGLGLISDDNKLLAYWKLDPAIVKVPPESALKMAVSPDFYLKLSNAEQATLIVTASVLFRHNATTERDAADAHPISSITGLQSALNSKVSLTGDQEIAGQKKFVGNILAHTIQSLDESVMMSLGQNYLMLGAQHGSKIANVEFKPEDQQIKFNPQCVIIGDGSGLNYATNQKAGVVKVGSNLSISSDGTLSGAAPYSLPAATANNLGGVRIGSNINVNSGTISVADANGSTKGVVTAGTGLSVSSGQMSLTVWNGINFSNLTSSRALNTNYTNNTARIRYILVKSTRKTDASQEFFATINGVSLSTVGFIHDSYPSQLVVMLPIPPGGSYKIEGSATTVLGEWWEM